MRDRILLKSVTFLIFLTINIGCQSGYQADGVKNEMAITRRVAKEMFEKLCLEAGEKIYKKIDNVDGIFLLKLRAEKLNFSDQYALDDPYGSDFTGEAYIESFLRGFYENNYRRSDQSIVGESVHIGYEYVDAIDVKDLKRYRYVGIVEQPGLTDPAYLKNYRRFVLSRQLAKGSEPRYGVTYEDISTKGERDYWIAGSSLKIVDLETNEILAERIGYMYDPGQGESSGGRSPWMAAASHSCPRDALIYSSTDAPDRATT